MDVSQRRRADELAPSRNTIATSYIGATTAWQWPWPSQSCMSFAAAACILRGPRRFPVKEWYASDVLQHYEPALELCRRPRCCSHLAQAPRPGPKRVWGGCPARPAQRPPPRRLAAPWSLSSSRCGLFPQKLSVRTLAPAMRMKTSPASEPVATPSGASVYLARRARQSTASCLLMAQPNAIIL